MKQFRSAVIGCGAISGVHLPVLHAMENTQLVAVCDNKPERAQSTAEKYGCAWYTDYNELLKDPTIDVVHVTTPHYMHVPITMAALKAGKFVVCEKPIAHELDDALALMQLPESHSKLALCFQNRYNVSTKKFKELIDSGVYGQLKALRGEVVWHRDPPYYTQSDWRGAFATEGGGVMINQAIHTLDLILWVGGKAESVVGSVSNLTLRDVIEVEDTANFVVKFANGLTASFYATNGYGVNAPILVEAVLEKATLQLRADSLVIIENGKETQWMPPVENDLGEKSYWGTGHGALIADAYRHFAEGKPFWIGTQAGYDSLQVIKKLYESSATGQVMTL